MKGIKTKPTLRNLRNICWTILISLFSVPAFSQTTAIDEIVEIINKNKSSISTEGIFQGLMDESKTKFVSTFAQASGLKRIGDLNREKNKKINIRLNDVNKVPNVLAYIVIGLKYESKWFFEKIEVTYFSADNLESGKETYLEQVNFPEESSIKKSANFWETGYFEKEKKVAYSLNPEEEKKLKKLARKEKQEIYKNAYLEIIKDLRNESYIGHYKIVAAALREEVKAELDSFEARFAINHLQPFFERFINENSPGITEYKAMSFGFPMILSPQRNLIISPILLVYEDGSLKVHYFLSMLNNLGEYEYFEWTFFPARKPKYPAAYSANAFEDMNTITVWNYSFDYLKDQKFWDEKVLQKKGDKYLYLNKID
jgi:hypothetical protein